MCGVCVCLTGLVARARLMDTLGALERLAVQETVERNTQLSSRRSESVTVNALKRFPHTHTHTHTHTHRSKHTGKAITCSNLGTFIHKEFYS